MIFVYYKSSISLLSPYSQSKIRIYEDTRLLLDLVCPLAQGCLSQAPHIYIGETYYYINHLKSFVRHEPYYSCSYRICPI